MSVTRRPPARLRWKRRCADGSARGRRSSAGSPRAPRPRAPSRPPRLEARSRRRRRLTLTFSKPVAKALGRSRPAVTPATAGTWTTLNSHTIRFQPTGYGYGLATPVSIGLPGGIRLVGGQSSTSASSGSWTVPAGSTVRLQQMLSHARIPAAHIQLLRLRGGVDAGGSGAGGRQTARRQLQLPLAEHAARAAGRVEGGRLRRDDPGRADGVREQRGADDRRGRGQRRLEGADRPP